MAIVSAPARPVAAPSTLSRGAALLAEPRRALLTAVVVLSSVVGLDALSDPDAWWHMLLGSWILGHGHVPSTEMLSYTANGAPLAPHEWLAGVLFSAVAGAGGLFVLALVMGLVSWAGLITVALHGRLRGAGPLTIAVWLALAAKAAEPVLGIRPQVFTFTFLALTLLITERHLRHGGRAIWLLPPMYLLWANIHGGFVAGIAFMAIAAAVAMVAWRMRLPNAAPISRSVSLAVVAMICALVACVNPQGIASYSFAFSEAAGEGAKGIVEWQPPNFTDPGLWSMLVLIVAFAATGVIAARQRRLTARDAALGVIACGAALLAVRNTSVCVAVVTPMVMGWTATATRSWARPRRPRAMTPHTLLAGAMIVAAAAGGLAVAMARLQASASPAGVAAAYPACAANVLQRSPAPQRIFTAYGDGGYILYRLWPHADVYIYGASDAFSKTWFANYYRIAAGATASPTAMQLLRDSGTTAVLFPSGTLTQQLTHAPGWTHVLSDNGMQLFVSGDASWAAGARC
jgi:hypothetical protein